MKRGDLLNELAARAREAERDGDRALAELLCSSLLEILAPTPEPFSLPLFAEPAAADKPDVLDMMIDEWVSIMLDSRGPR